MLDPSLQQILQSYKELLENVDKKCAEVLKLVPEIPCRKGCTDCCKQIFPLSLVEAWLINENFKTLDRNRRRTIAQKAKKAQGKLNKLNLKKYEIETDSLEEISEKRNAFANEIRGTGIVCPLLGYDNLCTLYDARNHDCRIHGVGFDSSSGEIVGCHRHKKIPIDTKLLIDSGYLYKEKSKLDSLLTVHLSQNPELNYCYYFTTPFVPLLKDFATQDWKKIFTRTPQNSSKKYSLVIDLEY